MKTLSSIRKEDELKRLIDKREKLVDKMEGNRPRVNDPRAYTEIKKEMTEDEYQRQKAGTEKRIKEFLAK
jgi:hypothetical protein